MKKRLSALLAGVLFGVGLAVAGMTQPSKVLGFLDVSGKWDPSLGLVMVGAIAVHVVGYRLARGRLAPVFDDRFHLPARRDVDPRLVIGALLFGAGWGLGGFCPGPALASAGAGAFPAILFVGAMLAGMLIERETTARHPSLLDRWPGAARRAAPRGLSGSGA